MVAMSEWLIENEHLKGSLASLQEQVTLLSRQLDAKEKFVPTPIGPTVQITDAITATDIMDEHEAQREKTLAEQYKDKFGKAPHHRMLEATILQKLKE